MLDHSVIFSLYFVCPLMSPTLPQSTKHAQTCARMFGQPHSRRGVGQVRQPPPPASTVPQFVIAMTGVCVASEGVVWGR